MSRLPTLLCLLLRFSNIHEIWSQKVLKSQMRYSCSTHAYPYIVLLMVRYDNSTWKRLCGGSLLRPTWVLTAAHCFNPEKNGTYGVLAGINQPDTNQTHVVLANNYILHPDFNFNDYTNDIALMQLEESIRDHVAYVKIPFEETLWTPYQEPPCSSALIIGWGDLESGSSPDVENLQCAKVPMIPIYLCQTKLEYNYQIIVSPEVLCSLSPDGVDACKGDSGGPLMCEDVQVGIVSWGIKCGVPSNPVIHTRTDKYLKFIEKNIRFPNNNMMMRRSDGAIRIVDLVLVLGLVIIYFVEII